jgi:hypothetical protein
VAAIALLLPSIALAADAPLRGTLLLDDFEPRAVQVVRISTSGVEIIDGQGGKRQTLPLDRLLRIDATDARPADAGRQRAQEGFAFVFRDGQRWSGTPGELKGDDLEFKPLSGEIKLVPLKSLAAVVSLKSPVTAQNTATAATADELLLANGDVASGVVSASTATNVTLTTADGTALPVDWTNVRAVRFAATGAGSAAASPPAGFRVSLADGGVLDGQSLELDENGLRLRTGGEEAMKFSIADVTSIESRGGKARLLANVPPTEARHEPYFPPSGSASLPPAANAVGPLSFAGRAVRSFIPARPRSVMSWSLDGTARTFATRYGIAEGRPLADVTVRVRLDDQVVHERAHVRAGALSQLLKLPLGTARTLTLEVDFGDTYDVQDDFHWVEPALLSE